MNTKISKLCVLTGLIIYAHFILEWLFFLTGATYFLNLGPAEKFELLLISPLLASAIAIPLLFILGPAASVVPAFLLGCSVFLLTDNFTYIVLGLGTANVRDDLRYLYAVVFVALLLYIWKRINRWIRLPVSASIKFFKWGLISAVFISVLTLIVSLVRSGPNPIRFAAPTDPSKFGDVLLLTGESLQADVLPQYGKAGTNAPFLAEFSKDAVIYKNVFANVNRTSGSLASVLTGKYPTTTHKLHSHHIFKGKDCYEHLPGILKQAGYHSIQQGWRHHADAFHWNMRESFDTINSRSPYFSHDFLGGRLGLELQFMGFVFDRVWDRLQHIFGGELMPLKPLYEPTNDLVSDQMKVEHVSEFLLKHKGPVLAHIHFEWIINASNVARFDSFVKLLCQTLKSEGRYDQAMIVIIGDHGRGYITDKEMPMIIKYPKGVTPDADTESNVQNLDVAPTILDSESLPIPMWMEGQSLLKSREKMRPIISINTIWNSNGLPLTDKPKFGFGGPQLITSTVCQELYRLGLKSGDFEMRPISNYSGGCPKKNLPSREEERALLIKHLSDRGYDVSQIPKGEFHETEK